MFSTFFLFLSIVVLSFDPCKLASKNVEISIHKFIEAKNLNAANLMQNTPRLTHVVMPFMVGSIDSVLANLSNWHTFPPCILPNKNKKKQQDQKQLIYYRAKDVVSWAPSEAKDQLIAVASIPKFPKTNLTCVEVENLNDPAESYLNDLACPKNVQFVFYMSHAKESPTEIAASQSAERILAQAWEALSAVGATAGFKDYQIVHIGLSKQENTYFTGSQFMIEELLGGRLPLNPVSHVFYMEADCRPIRGHWLANVAWHAQQSLWDPFWLKSSVFRGTFGKKAKHVCLPLKLHLNGNGIYHVGNAVFRDFYATVFKPWCRRQFGPNEGAYDTKLFKYLLHSSMNHTLLHEIWHLFKASEFMQNYWHSPYSIKEFKEQHPRTFFVHGGLPRP
jgi:hypothetical protein